MKSSSQEKLLGIEIDNRLTFKPHVGNHFKKGEQKLHALARSANYMDISKESSIVNTVILSQFSYCPLIWMFYIRRLHHRINKMNESVVTVTCNDQQCTPEELLERDYSFMIHGKNLPKLAIGISKVNNGLSVQLVRIIS